ncbi:hypothetical protein C8T65DRAFT_21221 [Cerioporus squamosus]|nr:hypothetical protein C8T65DRAFT_21221 [Cerioporus squamosus]
MARSRYGHWQEFPVREETRTTDSSLLELPEEERDMASSPVAVLSSLAFQELPSSSTTMQSNTHPSPNEANAFPDLQEFLDSLNLDFGLTDIGNTPTPAPQQPVVIPVSLLSALPGIPVVVVVSTVLPKMCRLHAHGGTTNAEIGLCTDEHKHQTHVREERLRRSGTVLQRVGTPVLAEAMIDVFPFHIARPRSNQTASNAEGKRGYWDVDVEPVDFASSFIT